MKNIFLTFVLFFVPTIAVLATEKPNILFIMSDDHCAQAIGAYGGRVTKGGFSTPNIDRLANEGMRFDRCFCTNSICVPSRASILTGLYSHHDGSRTLVEPLDATKKTFPELMQQGGYQTAVIGKWHVHTEPKGFDWYSILPGHGMYFNPGFVQKGADWSGTLKEVSQDGKEQRYYPKANKVYQGHVTDIVTDQCLDWMKGRDRTKPFMLLCHFKAPHVPFDQFPPRYKEYLDGEKFPLPETWNEDISHRSLGSRYYGQSFVYAGAGVGERRKKNIEDGKLMPLEKAEENLQTYTRNYLRQVKGNDDSIARLLDYLDKEKLTENTIVIYTSDQGFFLGEHSLGDKRWIWEESLRMPFIVRYPAKIKPGSVNDDIVLNVDFASTVLDAAGLGTMPNSDGKSFYPNMIGKTPSDWRDAMYYRYWMHMNAQCPAHFGVRTKEFKLVFFYGLPLDAIGSEKNPPTPTGWELYDLRTDPLEAKNVYDDPKYVETVKELKTKLVELRSKLGDTDEKYPEVRKLSGLY